MLVYWLNDVFNGVFNNFFGDLLNNFLVVGLIFSNWCCLLNSKMVLLLFLIIVCDMVLDLVNVLWCFILWNRSRNILVKLMRIKFSVL